MLKGKKIVLGVTGGIAVYKAVDLVSKLRKQGAEVRVIMTEHAQQFVTPLTFKEISGNKVAVSMWNANQEFNVEHIALADWADLFMVVPATANIIAKMAYGIADDLLSTTLLAAHSPVIVCPAMNTHMYENPATQENIAKIKSRGIVVMPPASGVLACGAVGAGRLPEPADIVNFVKDFFAKTEGDMRGVKVLVTAAGTREPIDPVRFITNHSSGKMGYALARAAMHRGAEVTVVAAHTDVEPPLFVNVVPVQTAEEMYDAIVSRAQDYDFVIKAAAVADYTPAVTADNKIKKKDGDMSIPLVRTKDILKALGENKRPGQILCGFSMETENVLENSRKKLESKHCDMICANSLKSAGAGFGTDTNIVTLITKNSEESLELMSKEQVAHKILDKLLAIVQP